MCAVLCVLIVRTSNLYQSRSLFWEVSRRRPFINFLNLTNETCEDENVWDYQENDCKDGQWFDNVDYEMIFYADLLKVSVPIVEDCHLTSFKTVLAPLKSVSWKTFIKFLSIIAIILFCPSIVTILTGISWRHGHKINILNWQINTVYKYVTIKCC